MPSSSARHRRTAEFVRGYFVWLEDSGINAAVLHGGENGFEGELTDIDFVIEHSGFKQITNLIHRYCQQVGWQLCQVFRHETTATFCVCAASDDPSCVVALDGCSDYQRNGTLFLSANALLDNIRQLPWGGFMPSEASCLKYRFAKGAAKNKDSAHCLLEFSSYSMDAREDCETWLMQDWNIQLEEWRTAEISKCFDQIRAKSTRRPLIFRPSSFKRIASRIQHPTGMIVVVGSGPNQFDEGAASLKNLFGHLYFRNFIKTSHFKPKHLARLITSTLIVTDRFDHHWSPLLPEDCIHHLNQDQDTATQQLDLANRLHNRCLKRERL